MIGRDYRIKKIVNHFSCIEEKSVFAVLHKMPRYLFDQISCTVMLLLFI